MIRLRFTDSVWGVARKETEKWYSLALVLSPFMCMFLFQIDLGYKYTCLHINDTLSEEFLIGF